MIAAILNPGPSLLRTYPGRTDAGLVMAVNRAATAFACDVWACGDYPAVQDSRDKLACLPALLTAENTAAALRDRNQKWPGRVVEFSELHSCVLPSVVDWPWVTALAAVVYAASVGATLIRCYGCDWSGEQDFDGVVGGLNRSEARWTHEAALFGALRTVLDRRGVTVERIAA